MNLEENKAHSINQSLTIFGNSADELHHPRSVSYSVEFVLLNKHQISGGGACLHCYPIVDRALYIGSLWRKLTIVDERHVGV